jgi:hypothetical protein
LAALASSERFEADLRRGDSVASRGKLIVSAEEFADSKTNAVLQLQGVKLDKKYVI